MYHDNHLLHMLCTIGSSQQESGWGIRFCGGGDQISGTDKVKCDSAFINFACLQLSLSCCDGLKWKRAGKTQKQFTF